MTVPWKQGSAPAHPHTEHQPEGASPGRTRPSWMVTAAGRMAGLLPRPGALWPTVTLPLARARGSPRAGWEGPAALRQPQRAGVGGPCRGRRQVLRAPGCSGLGLDKATCGMVLSPGLWLSPLCGATDLPGGFRPVCFLVSTASEVSWEAPTRLRQVKSNRDGAARCWGGVSSMAALAARLPS